MKFKLVLPFFTLLLLIGFSACNMDKTNTADNERENTLEGQSDDWKPEVMVDLLYLIPTPGEVIEQFYEVNISYKPNMVHTVDDMDRYIDSKSQALNLGVYVADLAYSARFERLGECIDYLEAIKTLGIEVGVSSKVFESLIARANNNINIVDSLVYISDEAFLQLFNYLEVSKKDNILAIVTTGAYVECLYLVLQSVEEYSENDPIIQQVSELKYPFDNLFSRSSMYDDDPNVNKVIKYLSLIKETFDQLSAEETSIVVSKTSESKLFISGGEDIKISEEDFINMKKEITDIRNQITGI